MSWVAFKTALEEGVHIAEPRDNIAEQADHLAHVVGARGSLVADQANEDWAFHARMKGLCL